MFSCPQCGISFPSGADLSKHRQRFCVNSKIDYQTQLMLRGDGGGTGGGNGLPPYLQGNAGASPSMEPRMNLRGSYDDDNSRRLSNTAYQRAANALPPIAEAPRSLSAEPWMPSNAGGLRPSDNMMGGNRNSNANGNIIQATQPRMWPLGFNNPPGGVGNSMVPRASPWNNLPPVSSNSYPSAYGYPPPGMGPGALAYNRNPGNMPSSYQQQQPPLYGGGGGGMDPEMQRLLEQQQAQLNQIHSMLGSIPSSNAQPVKYPNGSSLHGLSGDVIEGRYGIRIFAAEGLLAFHTIRNHTPIRLVIRQYYCRRRIGNYLPELEQRDEWQIDNTRRVTTKHRDGYVHFGRCDYVFNVVTANEVVLVIELMSKNRLLAWCEVFMDSLGDKVRRLRHPPVDIAGAMRDLTLRSTTATIGVELFRARWDEHGFPEDDDEEEEEEEEELPMPPKRKERPPNLTQEVVFYLDEIIGVPFNIMISRALVFVSPSSDTVPSEPVCVALQKLESPSPSPAFTASAKCPLTNNSCFIVKIEGVEKKRGCRVVLGHVVLPVRVGGSSGAFRCRVIRGNPNPANLIPQHVDPRDYVPCMQMKYRLDTDRTDGEYIFTDEIFDWEQQLTKERDAIPKANPRELFNEPDLSIKEAEKKFKVGLDSNVFDTSFLAPYIPQRGLFIFIEGLRGVGRETQLFKIVIEVGNNKQWTKKHDYKSDIGCPKYHDPPFIFLNVPHNIYTCVLFRIYCFKNPNVKGTSSIKHVAWGVAKLFVEPNNVRNGRYTIPIFNGKPAPSMLKELEVYPIERVLSTSLSSGEFYNYSTLTFDQGDPLRIPEFTQQYRTRPNPNVILVPEKQKPQFPWGDHAGEVGVPATVLLGSTSEAEFDAAMNEQLKKIDPTLP